MDLWIAGVSVGGSGGAGSAGPRGRVLERPRERLRLRATPSFVRTSWSILSVREDCLGSVAEDMSVVGLLAVLGLA